MSEQSEARRVPVERLCGFIERAFVSLGLPEADAATVAALMAEAEVQGSDGHGVDPPGALRRRIRAGGINLQPRHPRGAGAAGMALLDGDNGMGHLVMTRPPSSRSRRRAAAAWPGSARACQQPCRAGVAVRAHAAARTT